MVVRVHVHVFQVRRRPRGVAPALDLRRDRVDIEQIVDHKNRYKNEREDDGEQTQDQAEALLPEYFFYPRLGRLADLGRGHLCFLVCAAAVICVLSASVERFAGSFLFKKLLDQSYCPISDAQLLTACKAAKSQMPKK